MKYIFSLFLVIIFLTEHFSPLTRTANLLIKVVDNEVALCYSACDVDPLITEPEPQTDLWQHIKENIFIYISLGLISAKVIWQRYSPKAKALLNE